MRAGPEEGDCDDDILEILRTGPLALVEDLGRPGLAHMGVGRSGAADRRSHTLANRLVANPDDRATVEVTFGGFSRPGPRRRRRHRGDRRRHRPDRQRNPVRHQQHSPRPRRRGDLAGHSPRRAAHLSGGARRHRRRTPVLGSRSYDVMSAIGPLPLQPGDVLPVGEHTDDYPELDQAPVAAISGACRGTAGGARAARRLVRRPRRPGAHRLDGLRPQRPGRHAAGRAAWNTASRTGSCPARAPPAAQSRCRPTDFR